MNLSLRTRLLIISAIAVGLGGAATVGVGAYRGYQTGSEQARREGLQAADALAGRIQAQAEGAMGVARSLAKTMEGYLGEVPVERRERQTWVGMLRAQLAAHPDFTGVYIAFEPDAFDGRDKAHAGRPGETKAGRWSPYLNRGADGTVRNEPTEDMEDTAIGPTGLRGSEWYLRTRERRAECAVGPYPYQVQGREVWMSSFCVPILVGGRFLGLAGVDLPIEAMQQVVSHMAEEVRADALVANASGVLAAVHGGLKAKRGGHLREVHGEDWEQDLKQVREGGIFLGIDESDPDRIEIFAPLHCGADTDTWAVNLLLDVASFRHEAVRSIVLQVVSGGLAAFAGLFVAWLLAGRISRLVKAMTHAVDGVASGDYTRRSATGRSDELGHLARSLDATIERLGDLDTRLRTGIAGNARALGESAGRLDRTSGALAGVADDAAGRGQSAAAAAEQVAANVQTVAASVEELAASAREIAGNAGEAARVASEGVGVTQEVGTVVDQLGTSSRDIGAIVQAISEIAGRTNLLALNAAIEAAGAGEAGRGFAVVAAEVKDLARQAGESAHDIAARIQGVQKDASQAVEGVRRLAGIVSRIDQTQQAIAAAIEEQTATITELQRTVAEAAGGNQEVAADVARLAEAAHTTTGAVAEVRSAAAELGRLAAELERLVAAR